MGSKKSGQNMKKKILGIGRLTIKPVHFCHLKITYNFFAIIR